MQKAALLVERISNQPGGCERLFWGRPSGVAGLVDALAAGSRGRTRAAVSALTALAGSHAARLCTVIEERAVLPLVSILRNHAKNSLAACDAAVVLVDLFQGMHPHLNASAFIPALVEMAGSHDAGIQRHAAKALAILASSDALHRPLIAAVPALMAMASSDSAAMVQLALAALAQLSAGVEPVRWEVCRLVSTEPDWGARHPSLECYRMAVFANLAAFADQAPFVLQVRRFTLFIACHGVSIPALNCFCASAAAAI